MYLQSEDLSAFSCGNRITIADTSVCSNNAEILSSDGYCCAENENNVNNVNNEHSKGSARKTVQLTQDQRFHNIAISEGMAKNRKELRQSRFTLRYSRKPKNVVFLYSP